MTGVVEGKLAEAWVRCRTLHRPEVQDYLDYSGDVNRLVITCSQCADGYEVPARWPCPTALVLYGEREVAAALAGTPPEDET